MAIPAQNHEYFIIEKLNLQKKSHTAKPFGSSMSKQVLLVPIFFRKNQLLAPLLNVFVFMI